MDLRQTITRAMPIKTHHFCFSRYFVQTTMSSRELKKKKNNNQILYNDNSSFGIMNIGPQKQFNYFLRVKDMDSDMVPDVVDEYI